MENNIKEKLESGITSLLKAGRSTLDIAKMLSPQASFGKYEGCTFEAINEMALKICKEMNRRENQAFAQALRKTTMFKNA